jgi:hypothetical protein
MVHRRDNIKEVPFMPKIGLSATEIEALGEAIYANKIPSNVESSNIGWFLVLDVDSGDYEIDKEDVIATKRLLARLPETTVYGLRVGYPSAYRLGGVTA